jgi:DNA methylase
MKAIEDRKPRLYYEDGQCAIYHGDFRLACSGMTLDGCFPSRSITDPPYGSGFYETDEFLHGNELFDHLPGRTQAVFGYPELLCRWIREAKLSEPSEWITWWPTNGHSFGKPKGLPRETEHIAIWGDLIEPGAIRRPRSSAVVGKEVAEQRQRETDTVRLGDVWRDAAPGRGFNHKHRLHPSEKPLSLMERLVLLCSEPGDLILDPFAGSGTTLLAAKKLGRRAVGVELSERYCEVAAERLGQEVLDLGSAA